MCAHMSLDLMHQANDTGIAESGMNGNNTGCLLPKPDPELITPYQWAMSGMRTSVRG